MEAEWVCLSRFLLAAGKNPGFQVLGSLVINAVFAKCGILDLLTSTLLRRWKLQSKSFLWPG